AQQGKEQKMKNACVLLTTRDEDQETLQELAKREKLEATVLAATPLQSERPYFGNHPGRRDLQKEAALTVIILQRLEVQAGTSFRKGELKEKAVDEIVKKARALLPPKP